MARHKPKGKAKPQTGDNSFRGCPEIGGTKSGGKPTPAKQNENKLKNRATAPATVNPKITLDAILKPGSDMKRWKTSDGAEVIGYLVEVRAGGPESCNCGKGGPTNTDTHLALVQNHDDAAENKRFVVELTPRFKAQHADWTVTAMKRHLGKRLKVPGWMFFDPDHKDESENTNPGGSANWRATAWEIHPVTSLKVIG